MAYGEEGKRLGSGETYLGTAALGCPAERTLDWLFSPSPKTGDLPTRAAAALATVPHIVYARARQRRLDTLLIYVSVYCNTTCISLSPGTPAWLMLNTR
jgi:hypothetical protein